MNKKIFFLFLVINFLAVPNTEDICTIHPDAEKDMREFIIEKRCIHFILNCINNSNNKNYKVDKDPYFSQCSEMNDLPEIIFVKKLNEYKTDLHNLSLRTKKYQSQSQKKKSPEEGKKLEEEFNALQLKKNFLDSQAVRIDLQRNKKFYDIGIKYNLTTEQFINLERTIAQQEFEKTSTFVKISNLEKKIAKLEVEESRTFKLIIITAIGLVCSKVFNI